MKKVSATPKAEGDMAGDAVTVLEHLLRTQVPAEDRAGYGDAALKAAAEAAAAALRRHRSGHSVIDFANDRDLAVDGRPVTAITIVNDNMPFLFDSLLGEIHESCGDLHLVIHPVLAVTREGKDKCTIHGVANRRNPPDGTNRISLIHIHASSLDGNRQNALRARIETVLSQVHDAVHDWKDMLIRLDHAISVYRHSQDVLDPKATQEAAEFLEWLRDDNFTFLGMREYRLGRRGKTGTLKRTGENAASASCPIPTCVVLRRGARGGDHHARDPRLPARPGPADRHQGQRQVGRPPPRLSRLCRRQDLRTRTAS